MNISNFVPSTLHIVASGVDVTQDLQSSQGKSISTLLNTAYEKEEKTKKENN
jgi:hypothetical protein